MHPSLPSCYILWTPACGVLKAAGPGVGGMGVYAFNRLSIVL